MPDIPWHIVAIVFIAFVSWVYNKFQEVAAERRRKRFNQVKRSYEKQERQGQPVRETPPPSKQRSAMETILEGLGVPLEELEEEAERKQPATPPPVPKKEPKLVAPKVEKKPIVSPPVLPQKQTSGHRVRRKRQVAGIRKLLRGRDALRQALIASEVLQKPKGLED